MARLVALGAERGLARQIAAIECGLIEGDRTELEDLEDGGNDLLLPTEKSTRGKSCSSSRGFHLEPQWTIPGWQLECKV